MPPAEIRIQRFATRLWPRDTHDAVNAAWSSLSNEGSGFEVPAHVISAALDAIRGLRLVPGFKVRLPTDPNGEGHPTFIKGSGRNPAFLRLRDFTDSLVMCAEATLSRDAAAAPLAKGKCKLPEQRALRQHLGLPLSSAAQRARLRARDFGSMLADGGVPLPPATVAQLVSLIGGPLPEVPALARSASQPVPYLEAERLLLCTLPKAALDAVLKTDVGATAIARAQQARVGSRSHHYPIGMAAIWWPPRRPNLLTLPLSALPLPSLRCGAVPRTSLRGAQHCPRRRGQLPRWRPVSSSASGSVCTKALGGALLPWMARTIAHCAPGDCRALHKRPKRDARLLAMSGP